MRITKEYVFFWGSEFSNWYPSEFELEGKKFYNAEQYFMYKKAKHFNDEEIAIAILCTDDPKLAKKLGRKVKNFDSAVWLTVCKDYMKEACRAKFTQNLDLKKILLSHKTQTYVEASPFDVIWGVGMSEDNPKINNKDNWLGMNLLGEVLTELRDELSENNKEKLIKT